MTTQRWKFPGIYQDFFLSTPHKFDHPSRIFGGIITAALYRVWARKMLCISLHNLYKFRCARKLFPYKRVQGEILRQRNMCFSESKLRFWSFSSCILLLCFVQYRLPSRYKRINVIGKLNGKLHEINTLNELIASSSYAVNTWAILSQSKNWSAPFLFVE